MAVHRGVAISDEAYQRMERKFAAKSGGLFVGTDLQAPRSLQKAKEKVGSRRIQAC